MATAPLSRRDSPPFEADAWRPVVSGLNLMVRALRSFFLGSLLQFLVVIAASFAGLSLNSFTPLYVAFGILCAYVIGSACLFFLGVGLCCAAPAEMHANRYAQSALVMALASFSLGLLHLSIEFIDVFQDLADYLEQFRHLIVIPVAVTLLAGTLAVLCWHLFIRAVATIFHDRQLEKNATHFLVSFSIWAAVMIPSTCAVFIEFGDDGAWLLWACIPALFGVSAGPALFAWAVNLLLDVRRLLRARTSPDESMRTGR